MILLFTHSLTREKVCRSRAGFSALLTAVLKLHQKRCRALLVSVHSSLRTTLFLCTMKRMKMIPSPKKAVTSRKGSRGEAKGLSSRSSKKLCKEDMSQFPIQIRGFKMLKNAIHLKKQEMTCCNLRFEASLCDQSHKAHSDRLHNALEIVLNGFCPGRSG